MTSATYQENFWHLLPGRSVIINKTTDILSYYAANGISIQGFLNYVKMIYQIRFHKIRIVFLSFCISRHVPQESRQHLPFAMNVIGEFLT